jgi:hypothetical protein
MRKIHIVLCLFVLAQAANGTVALSQTRLTPARIAQSALSAGIGIVWLESNIGDDDLMGGIPETLPVRHNGVVGFGFLSPPTWQGKI